MWWLIAPCPYCPFRDKGNKKADKIIAELTEDNRGLRQQAIENGLEVGGSIYVEGQENE
jgi:hypothetical protein